MSKDHNNITINKRNEIIRGGNTYSLSAQKLGNAIYHHVQLNKVYKNERFKIPISSLREVMGLEKTNAYIEVIKRAVKELSEPIMLYNTDRITGMAKRGQETLWQVAQFLIEPRLIKEGKEKYIEAQMSPTMRVLIASSNDGNFTQLVLNTHLNNLKSKHSYVLYEYIKSFQDFNVIGNRIELSFERLDKMFNLEGKKKYHYFSSFKPLLERCVNDLNERTDMFLRLATDKKLKKYYIYRLKNKEEASKKKRKVKEEKDIESSGYYSPLGKLCTDTLKNTEKRREQFQDKIIDVEIVE